MFGSGHRGFSGGEPWSFNSASGSPGAAGAMGSTANRARRRNSPAKVAAAPRSSMATRTPRRQGLTEAACGGSRGGRWVCRIVAPPRLRPPLPHGPSPRMALARPLAVVPGVLPWAGG